MSELIYNWYMTPNTYLDNNQAEKNHNALNLLSYLRRAGWSDLAIAGAAGNFEVECHFNPGLFEGRTFSTWPTINQIKGFPGGYGLGQWTPAYTKFVLISVEAYGAEDYRNAWLQCIRLTKARDSDDNHGIWQYKLVGGLRFGEYITKTDTTPEEMARLWWTAYEAPGAPNKELRKQWARYYYDLFINTPDSALPTIPDNPINPGEPPDPTPPDPPLPPEPQRFPYPIWYLKLFKRRNKKCPPRLIHTNI